jgi:hypothetical protein
MVHASTRRASSRDVLGFSRAGETLIPQECRRRQRKLQIHRLEPESWRSPPINDHGQKREGKREAIRSRAPPHGGWGRRQHDLPELHQIRTPRCRSESMATSPVTTARLRTEKARELLRPVAFVEKFAAASVAKHGSGRRSVAAAVVVENESRQYWAKSRGVGDGDSATGRS